MPNGGSRFIIPITVQRMMDIHSNAARFPPKPMLVNAAQTTRMVQNG
jgi:hypothetical protein